MIKTVNDVVSTRKCYVLYDDLAQDAGPIFDAASDEIAVRSTVLAIADCEYVKDIRLVHVCNINSVTMQCEPVEPRDVEYRSQLDRYLESITVEEGDK